MFAGTTVRPSGTLPGMADKHSGGDKREPTLELPKLFGRRRRASGAEEPPVERSAPPSSEHAQPTRTEPPLFAEEPPRAPEAAHPTAQEPGRPAAHEAAVPAAAPEEPGSRKAARTTPLLPPRLAAVLTG